MVNCIECHGHGVVEECQERFGCRGEDCSNCDGCGFVDCERCDGSGEDPRQHTQHYWVGGKNGNCLYCWCGATKTTMTKIYKVYKRDYQ